MARTSRKALMPRTCWTCRERFIETAKWLKQHSYECMRKGVKRHGN